MRIVIWIYKKILSFRIIYHLRKTFWKCINKIRLSCVGVKYEKGLNIHNHIYFIVDGYFEIGKNFIVTSGNGLNSISQNVKGHINILKGAFLKIGDDVRMSSPSIWVKSKVIIGDRVLLGANCLIIDDDAHSLDFKERYFLYYGINKADVVVKSSPIEIGNDVWIGAHCIILKGVHIGARSIIGAGSVVTKDIPPDCIAAGNPCRFIRHIND